MGRRIVQVTTYPFGASGPRPREVLEGTNWDIRYNTLGRRLKPAEVPDLVREAHGLVAGTEPYTKDVLTKAEDLKVISRVGVGLDNIDFEVCRERGIVVTFTPEAPADAVAEITVAQIVNLLRRVRESDQSVREGAWNRYLGRLVREAQVGILGVGRIGKRVIKLLQPFQPRLFGCDLKPDLEFSREYGFDWLTMEEMFATCDLISIHVPLNTANYHLIGRRELLNMRPGGMIVNFSRGKIVDEPAVVDALKTGHLAGAAMDVFESEPYEGPLTQFPNVVLTAHIGASAREGRFMMELQAAEDCVRVLTGETPRFAVTEADLA